RACLRPVLFDTLPARVSGRFSLIVSISPGDPLAEDRDWQLAGGYRNSAVTKFRLSSKKMPMLRPLAVIFGLISIAPALFATQADPSTRLVISVRDQQLMLLQNGGKVATYPVSTSMFGLGDYWGRVTMPFGYLAVGE